MALCLPKIFEHQDWICVLSAKKNNVLLHIAYKGQINLQVPWDQWFTQKSL